MSDAASRGACGRPSSQRAAIYVPANVQHQSERDELYEGRRKLTLSFDLPRGSYATILIKRMIEVA